MKLRLLTVSHKQPDWVQAGCRDFERRLPREWGFEVVELKPGARTSGAPVAKVQADEAQRLLAAVPKGARLVALDERGASWATRDLAQRLAQWQQDGRDVAFAIGGADGLADEVLRAAEARLSLSAMTLPHGLVRVVFVEQIYRAATILQGHPYHK